MTREQRLPAVFVSTSAIVWGAETSLLVTAQHLARQGVPVGLLAQAPGFVEQWPGGAKRLARGAGFYARLAWTALVERPEALVCCSLRLAAAFAPLRLLPAAVRPALVFDLHDYMPGEGGRRRMRVAMWWFDRVIAVSGFAASQLSQDYSALLVLARPVEGGTAADGATGAATGAADGRSSASADGTGVPGHSGVVGRLDADKRIELALEAVALLPGTELVLRGASGLDEEYTEGLRRRAHELLGERVVFEGRVPRERVMSGLSSVVIANDEEALGRTVAEAQLAGVPVVSPDRGGARDLVEDGVTGRRFEAGSAASLAAVVGEVLDDPVAAGRAAQRARRVAAERHDPARVAREYLRFAVSGPSARPLRALAARLAGRLGARGTGGRGPAVPAPRRAAPAAPQGTDTPADLQGPR